MAGKSFVTGSPLVAFTEEGRVVSWNDAMTALTGVGADEAMGRRCWDVLRIRDTKGAPLCTASCRVGRCALAGEPVDVREAIISTRSGCRHVSLATMAVTGGDEPIGVHVLTGGRDLTPEEIALVRDLECLTARQRDVLDLLSQGIPAKLIALRLGLAERTVRNYIREILMLLRCNSQLEALAKLGPLGPRLVRDAAGAQ